MTKKIFLVFPSLPLNKLIQKKLKFHLHYPPFPSISFPSLPLLKPLYKQGVRQALS